MSLKPETLAGWPHGGWCYYQPQTRWEAPFPLQHNFAQQVANIQKMRAANPRFNLATDYESVARDLADYTEARLRRAGHHDRYVLDDGAEKKTPPGSQGSSWRPPRLAGAAVPGESSVPDASALLAWFGAGGTAVEHELAEARAAVCAGCPQNSESDACPEKERNSWTDWLTAPVAAGFRLLLGMRNRMKLATSQDAALGKCLACRCELKLKVHTPLAHITDTMEEGVEARLDPRCWVLHEAGSLQ